VLYLNYCGLNVILDEEDDNDVQDNDLKEDTASVPEVLDRYNEVYSNMLTDTHMLKHVANLLTLQCKKI
jgi:hypothetical protein